MMEERKFIMIKRKTRLEELVFRYNTREQAKFYVEHLGQDFSIYIDEDREYHEALQKAIVVVEEMGKAQVVDRSFLPNFIFGERDVIVVIGQDGLVANTLKYLNQQVIIGVNPSPKRYDGILLPFQVEDLKSIIKEVVLNKRPIKEVTMAKASLNDGQEMIGVNDLFIGQKSHVSARYSIQIDKKSEAQSSSGIIVSTGLGSTGWLKSIIQGAANITSQPIQAIEMSWDSSYLMFSVREPFPSRTSKVELTFGRIEEGKSLQITSWMPENGVIFSDGMENDYLEFTSGKIANIGIAARRGRLVV